MRRSIGLLLVLAFGSVCLGYGGFDVTAAFADYAAHDFRLTQLNREWNGGDVFRTLAPNLWFGGHGAGVVYGVTIGGRGGVGLRQFRGDAILAEFLGVQGYLDVGYRIVPVEPLWIRPSVEIGGGPWVYYVHDRQTPFADPNFSRWFLGWTVGVAPGLELMGRWHCRPDRYAGVFVKTSYFFPIHGPDWYLDANPPGFDLRGIHVQLGVRFGTYPPRRIEI